jgi:hypothetical protein
MGLLLFLSQRYPLGNLRSGQTESLPPLPWEAFLLPSWFLLQQTMDGLQLDWNQSLTLSTHRQTDQRLFSFAIYQPVILLLLQPVSSLTQLPHGLLGTDRRT